MNSNIKLIVDSEIQWESMCIKHVVTQFVFFSGNLVAKRSKESQQLQHQMQTFKNSIVSQMQEISSRDQVYKFKRGDGNSLVSMSLGSRCS